MRAPHALMLNSRYAQLLDQSTYPHEATAYEMPLSPARDPSVYANERTPKRAASSPATALRRPDATFDYTSTAGIQSGQTSASSF